LSEEKKKVETKEDVYRRINEDLEKEAAKA